MLTQQDLMKNLFFTEEDLVKNKNGFVSSDQRRRLGKSVKVVIIGTLVCAAIACLVNALILVVSGELNIGILIVSGVIVFTGLLIAAPLFFMSMAEKALMVEGSPVYSTVTIPNLQTHTTQNTEYVAFGNIKFVVSPGHKESFLPGNHYRVYYTGGMFRYILSAELLLSSSEAIEYGEVESPNNALNIVSELEKLNYFEYVPANILAEVKELYVKEIARRSLPDINTGDGEHSDELAEFVQKEHSLEGKIFNADLESLAEGGVEKFLKELEIFLKREGVKFKKITQDSSDDHYKIKIDNKEYVICNNEAEVGDWGTIERSLSMMFNSLLEAASSKKRVFTFDPYGGTPNFIFLTLEQYRLILDSGLSHGDYALCSSEIKSKILGVMKQKDKFKNIWSDTWESESVEVGFFDGKKIPVEISAYLPSEDPDYLSHSEDVLQRFLSKGSSERTQASEAVYKNCMDSLDTASFDEADQQFRDIKDKNDIWNFVYPKRISIEKNTRGDGLFYVVVECECEWEPEHGLQLVFKNGEDLVRVSQQDGHLLD